MIGSILCLAALTIGGGGGAEFHSAYVSRGKVNVDQPTIFLDANLKAKTENFGFVQIGWWDFSSLTDRRQHGYGYRHHAFIENDLYVLYGYEYEFAPGWSLCAKAGHGWYILNGFTEPNNIVEQDIVTDATFKSPYLWITWFTRSNYWPDNTTSMTLGFFKPIDLGCDFWLYPGFLLDGGNHKWVNKRHSAAKSGESIHAGFTSMSFNLEVWYQITENIRIKAGARQMDIFDRRARRAVRNSGDAWLHADCIDMFFGVTCRF